jgi:cyclopropane-fatty-acyl-phospholipid synthase
MFFQKIFFKMMSKIKVGNLSVSFNGKAYLFGNQSDTLSAEIIVSNENFFKKMILGGSIGVAESYFLGEWNCDKLTDLFVIMIKNLAVTDELDSNKFSISRIIKKSISLILNRNTEKNSKKNIASHYDLSNDLFACFLDPLMQYSSAVFEDKSNNLNEAQLHKIKIISEALSLKQSDSVLEIGSGWGGLSCYMAKNYGCKVKTLTLSEQQYEYCQRKIQAEGLNDKVTVVLQDYRQEKAQYDKVVSIEMIEAVGHQYFPNYFEICHNSLKESGLLFLQLIAIKDDRYEAAKNDIDFIQYYIFPGSCLPSEAIVKKYLLDKYHMEAISRRDISFDYAKTLACWDENFFNKKSTILSLGFDEQFFRLWHFYFAYCEAGFLEKHVTALQLLFKK